MREAAEDVQVCWQVAWLGSCVVQDAVLRNRLLMQHMGCVTGPPAPRGWS